jgi:alpha-tubulin suppressor-like RCC1 family protein
MTRALLRRWSAVLGCAAAAACSDGPAEPAPEAPKLRVAIVAGDEQTGAAGLLLPRDVGVAVTRDGAPAAGVEVTWRALEGGGWTEPDRSTTDAQGRAATRWHLGDDFGRHLLLASVEGAEGVTFRAWAELFFTTVSAGWRHSCGLDAKGWAWCWGDNAWGQLGDGTKTGSPESRRVSGGRIFARVEAGNLHSCALTSDGDAFCWGDNGLGQLGDGTNTSRPAPVAAAEGVRFRSLAPGGTHTCGVDLEGALHCWGSNQDGQVGVAGSGTCSVFGVAQPCATRPERVALSGSVAKVAAGESHTCALTAEGKAYCWGRNDWGQLGIGRFGGTAAVPTPVLGALRFRDIAAGPANTCALDEQGAAWCWGMAARGVLGVDTVTSNRDRPFAVTMPAGVTFLEIGLGDAHACARGEAGVWCWGAVLGNGTAGPSRVPVRVGGTAALGTLTVGGAHACGFDEGVWCWGANAYGQLGVPKDSVATALLPLRVRRSPPE